METGTFYLDCYHILVCLLLVFCKLNNLISLVVAKCLLLPVTGYAHAGNAYVVYVTSL